MYVYVCGLNTNKQILHDNLSVVCCPTLMCVGDPIHVTLCFTHIFWKDSSGWKVTGYKQKSVPGDADVETNWKIYGSGNRTAAVSSDGSLLVWEGRWRTLHFQSYIEELENSCQHYSFPVNNSQYVHSYVTENTEDFSEPHKTRKELGILEASGRDQVTANDLRNTNHKTSPHKCSSNFDQVSFSHVAVEDNTLLALRSDGVVLYGSVPVPLKTKVKEIAVGKEHCMVLTEEGQVYTWGGGMHGQLGIGELCKSEEPVVINNLQGIMISSVACGAWHCIAQSDCGDVYVWGWNESGQLGFPPKSSNSHTLFDSFQHTCQCPGSKKCSPANKYEQKNNSCREGKDKSDKVEIPCGLSARQSRPKWDDSRVNSDRSRELVNVQASPKLLDFWTEDVNVTNVVCGDRHTIFLLEDGSAWAAGMNRFGQLGLGHTRAREEPSLVLRAGVTKVFAGGWNSVFITTTPLQL
ncbi:hypothetical protein Pmani_005489 [Petrolisthes manimaculis]|uniref:RCC1 domain containing 1 n=1 Tax=Petrolisthes manimaculis TaxID=1843537 RepID=A0AAE1QC56_9EUCA|nr:hypothetical protein Pmani_005489 [Petrolisthes manimaculis]